MKNWTLGGLGALAVLASGISVSAQTGPIRVFVDPNTGTFTELTSARADDGDPVNIDLTGLFPSGISGPVHIRIFDEDTITTDCVTPWNAATHSIGHITITGSVHSSPAEPPRLSIAIMHSCDTFPTTPETPLDVGCINFAGLSFSSGSEALRDVARVAVAVSGDITGNITAGHVFRVQARGRMVSTTYTGGTISGNITATLPRFHDVSYPHDSVAVVWAGHELAGDVIATAEDPDGDSTAFQGGSIGKVFVGVGANTAAAGITGDIKAEHGRIEQVHTAEPIGSVSVTPKIWAGLELQEVRVLEAASIGGGGTPTIGSADIKADIKSGLDIQNTIGASPQNVDGPVYLIETKGNLTGAIDIANLTYPIAGVRQYGIIVGGAITAPVNIRYNLEIVDIIAASIDAPITIGCSAKGAIVATAENGQIVSVEIGYANEGLDEEDEDYDDRVEMYDLAYPRGFKGSACSPVNPNRVAPSGTYTHADWTTTVVNHCLDGSTPVPVDSGSVDSVIRASYIGSVRVAAMTDMYSFGTSLKSHFPRIESPEIGSLEIGLLRNGVVWSGNLTFEDDELVWDPAEAYANIGTISIGCIAQAGDLWVDGTTRIEIAGDVLGQIRVPTLTDTLWIGGRLGLWSAFGASCANQGLGTGGLAYANVEDSPRDSTWTGEDTRARGEIVIREVGGLQGQIIINGNNNGGTWDGAVIVGDELGYGNRVVITPDDGDDEFDPDFEAPHYLSPSGPLGGGAVGLAPFAFYPTDCVPPHNDPDPLVGIITTAFESGYPVLVRWYGPVTLPQDPPPPSTMSLLKVRVAWPFDECVPTPAVDLTSIFAAALHADGKGRTLGLGANVQPRGVEHFLLWNPESEWGQLVCDDIVGKPEVTFAVMYCTGSEYVPDRYIFRVHEDCNANDVPDPVEIDNDPDLDRDRDGYLDDCDPTNCQCDWNANQRIDVADIFLFLNDWFADDCAAKCFGISPSPCPTPDASCGVPALFAFLTCWFNSFSDPLCNP